jgi:hypothetical protein
MKKLIVIFFLTAIQNASAQNAFYNNGSVIQINGNAVLQINGDMVNAANSNFVNEGTVNLKGNFTNNQYMNASFTGVTRFEGNAIQTINGSKALFAKNVEIAARVVLNDTLKIDGECKFFNGVVKAANSTIPVWFTNNGFVSVTNAPSNASHVNGYVVKEGTGPFTYPVGDSNRYQKVDIDLVSNTNGMLVKYDTTNAGTGPYIPGGFEGAPLVTHNKLENWNCTPIGGAVGRVTIFWDDYKNVGNFNITVLRVAHYHSSSWINEGDFNSIVGSPISGSVKSNMVNTWSPFTLGSIDFSSPLPVKWLTTNANLNISKQAVITWKVQENNVATYDIQKSNNGINFTTIGNVTSKGNGENNYAFTDAEKVEGKIYYRILQKDNDGRITYSNVMLLNVTPTNTITVYPNPTTDAFIINTNQLQNTTAILTDMSGKVLQNIIIKQSNTKVDIINYPQGIYLLKIADSEVFKIIKN